MEALIGGQELPFAGLDIDLENAVTGWGNFFLGPIQGLGIAGHQSQPGKPSIVEPHKKGAISAHTAIADGGI